VPENIIADTCCYFAIFFVYRFLYRQQFEHSLLKETMSSQLLTSQDLNF